MAEELEIHQLDETYFDVLIEEEIEDLDAILGDYIDYI